MNKKVKHGSVEELQAINARENAPHATGLIGCLGLAKFAEILENYDPKSEKSRRLAQKYSK